MIGTWELFDKVFQGGSHVPNETDESAVDNYKNRVWVCIANLRKKIEHGGEYGYIQTVQSIGYRFRAKGPD